ncbi:hypothetical protein CYMTET_17673 [Cymbomonas tetramitiformis]|uniref:Uncharacterized protein n=1 Tax=Cymbomonas tetramitiformis TaxID=36881 RepID=A0AAE0GAZ7_9CHLO|nr:hypothetical protein CYMTET_17673 [Cymbomonas tetramitiformis]
MIGEAGCGTQVNHEMVRDYGDLGYLVKERYNAWFHQMVQEASPWSWQHRSLRDVAGAARTSEGSTVLLLTYRIEDYPQLANAFGLWPYPRAHHNHVAYARYEGVLLLVADARFAAVIPEALKIPPSASLQAVPARPASSCNGACADVGLRCSEPDFWFINNCQELAKHFPCERGCALVLGPDIPNYVHNPALNTYQKCLVTQEQSRCSASHPSTTRLCACV